MKNLVEELTWRGLVHNISPGTEEQLLKESTSAYIGFDPTSDSLHIGSLVPIILLKHLKNYGHNPIALIGGATGMIGDPSGKSNERNLLDENTLNKNVEGVKNTLSRFLDINSDNLVNNYDWMKSFSFIDFVRDIGKRITVNYMMNKDSVKKRIDGEGMSFTEFTYQLIQGYDFYYLNKNYNCLLQMGGSDQWGNMTTGTELIHKMDSDSKAFLMTCPLITKSDGTKFGKSEGGNIWLDSDKTSVYKFYQFWLNISDVDAEKYIKIFTFLDKEIIDTLITEHNKEPHLRLLQKRLAKEVTVFVHGELEFEKAIHTSSILFGKSTFEDLSKLDERTFLEIFDGVLKGEIDRSEITNGIEIVNLIVRTGFLKSNKDVRRSIAEKSLHLNKEKITEEFVVNESHLINDKFLLLQKGKNNYFLIIVK